MYFVSDGYIQAECRIRPDSGDPNVKLYGTIVLRQRQIVEIADRPYAYGNVNNFVLETYLIQKKQILHFNSNL